MSNKPLYGIKVLELGLHVTAPSCAEILRLYGAEVIKIEQKKGGDPWRGTSTWTTQTPMENSPIFDLYNMGKRSIVINFKDPAGMEVLQKLLSESDIFLTNVRLKSLKNSGLDPDTLCEKYPRLIYGRITGYGDEGPMAGVAAFDNIAFWARTGLARDMIYAEESDEPLLSGVGIGDAITGDTLCTAVLAALYQRERTGKGGQMEASLFGTGVWASGCMILQAQKQYGKTFPRKLRNTAMYDPSYRCKDGKFLKMGNKNSSVDIPKLLDILGIKEVLREKGLVTVTDMLRNGYIIVPYMKEAFLKKDAAEWISLLQAEDLAVEYALHFRDVSSDAQAIANGYVYDYELRGGDHCMMPDFPVRSDTMKGAEHLPAAPMIGEHTAEILRELGYSEEAVEEYIGKFC